jgi:hypothetical protein
LRSFVDECIGDFALTDHECDSTFPDCDLALIGKLRFI